jgi:thiosulfate/3-mercaptopyruvate sulfurtransferase
MRKLMTWFVLAVTPMVAAGQSAGLLVDGADLAARLSSPETVVLHVGDPATYAAGHVPGARLVPPGALAAPRAAGDPAALYLELPEPELLRTQLQQLGITADSRIVVMFGKDEFPQATRVLYTLDAAGFGDRVALLDGGLPEWRREGRPVTAEVPTVTASALPALTLKPRSADAAFIQANAGKPSMLLVDARAPQFYSGAEIGRLQTGQRAGHLPGARSVPFTSVASPALRLRSRDELTRLFADAGAKPGDRVVVYCHIGQQASAVQFAARLAGLDAVIYDGSFQDWAQQGLPLTVGDTP